LIGVAVITPAGAVDLCASCAAALGEGAKSDPTTVKATSRQNRDFFMRGILCG
jgi:hypothetical protein